MARKRLALILTALLGLLAFAPAGGAKPLPRPPVGFFGIAPQTPLTAADVGRMRAGGIESIRIPIPWAQIQPTPAPDYDWSAVDQAVEVAAKRGLRVLPFLYATPDWLAPKPTILPIDTARKRNAWFDFVYAAVARYGRYGEFWREHSVGSEDPVPKLPIKDWQIWNEANFFYFATPASPTRYARLLQLTRPAVRAADPRAKVILSGLFGDPDEGWPRGMPASKFLARLYRVWGIKAKFDGVALHPYAFQASDLERLTEDVRAVMAANHDRSTGLYITEMGWGSQNDPNIVAFEQGRRGQVRQLRAAFTYLLENQRRLNLRQAYWFSWKDIDGACSFCDSAGFFHAGDSFRPKPAWHAFVALTRTARRGSPAR